MIFIDKMKNFKIYKTKTFLPTLKEDKKRGSAILMMTPNFDSSKRVMNSTMFVNNKRYESYYLEKDVSYYIGKKYIKEIEESTIIDSQYELSACLETARSELDDSEFGVSSKRKFPLDTEAHVRSAVKFFNYVDEEDEKELADKLNKAIEKYNIKINVSEKNRFSKYYKAPVEEASNKFTIPRECPICNGDIELLYNDSPVWRCTNCGKLFSTVDTYIDNIKEDVSTSRLLESLPSDTLNLGDKILLLNEANITDTQLKKLLFNSRIRYRKDQMLLLDQVKNDISWIKYAYPELKKYVRRNVFVDLYYYNAIFFQNNTWTKTKGFNLYLEFMKRLLNHPNLKSAGYRNNTIFIPVKDWDITKDGMIWNYRKSINPISCIYQLMYTGNYRGLLDAFGNTDILFLNDNMYFKINFSQLDAKDIKKYSIKFKLFCIKICKNETFDDTDIDTSADHKEDSDVIAAKVVDKIEAAKGIDLTSRVNKAKDRIIRDINSNKNPIVVAANTTKQDKKTKEQIKKNNKELDDELDYNEEDEIDNEKNMALSRLSDAIASASIDATDEDDAYDNLDNDEIKKILLNLGDDNEVDISPSRSTRMANLNNAFLNKEIKGKSVKDILANERKEDITTTINVASPNKEEWSNLSYMNLDKDYDIDKDILSIFKMFSSCSRPMVVKDINVTDASTSEDSIMLYDVIMEDYKGKRHRIKLDIPIMEDNRFFLRGDSKSIQTQFFNIPIMKVDLARCQISSNYRKIFIDRFAGSNGRSLPAVYKFLKACNKYKGNKLTISFGDNSKVCAKYHLPMDYIDISGSISKIESKDWIIYFNQDDIRNEYTIDNTKGIPCIYDKKTNSIEYFEYRSANTTFIKDILFKIFSAEPELEKLYMSASRSSGSAYSRAYIMKRDIPVVVLCGYYVGLSNTMDRAGIKYTIEENLSRETKLNSDLDWIEFDDGYIVYDINYESSLLMSGLKTKGCPTEIFSIKDIDNKNMWLEFLDNYGGRILSDSLDNFYDLFIDPMTEESLKYYHLPTDYIDLLIYGSSMLADNKYTKHTDARSRRLRRYQLISVYTYQVLANAYGEYMIQDKHTNNPTFAVKQSAVIDAFLTDNITSDDSYINALRDVETTNSVTTKGPSGMNSDRAYTLDKRAYDESMINVLGMSTGFAGNVGITRQATINANVTSEGYVKDTKDKDMNDANTLTATEALIPFGSTRDDPMRTAMSFIQTSKHMVRTEDSDPLLVTSGADEVMPYITTNRFAYKAKDDGIVLELNENYMLVEYKNKKKDYINLKESVEKNSDGGYYVPLKLTPSEGMKASVKFKKDQILAYDTYSFSNKLGESNNLAYNIGKLAKIAILNTDEGFEDAGIISDSMAKKLATRVIIKSDTVINKDSRVFSILKVGDHVEAGDDLIIWQDALDDEDAEAIISGISGDEFSDIGKRRIKSDTTGTLVDIKIYRTVELEDLSPSLKKIVSEYEKPLKEEAKLLKDNNISTSKVAAHYKLNPTGKLKKAQEAVFIEFYIEYLDIVGVGDKIVYNSANKAVEKAIFPVGKEPYTSFRPNEKIDAFVSDTSISKRLVTSTIIYGSIQKLMIELDRSVKDIMGIPYDDKEV
jgi:hypothetical protein